MTTKTFWIPLYPRDALIDFSELKADEIGVFIQIILLIYIHLGPIKNDPRHIGKLSNIQKTKCERIINRLIHKEKFYINHDGKIFQKRCEKELDLVANKRKIKSKNGQKGAEIRWNNKQNQEVENGKAKIIEMANSKTRNNKIRPNNLYELSNLSIENLKQYDISRYISDLTRKNVRNLIEGCDLYALMEEYNHRIRVGNHPPPNDPNKAFLAWCGTKINKSYLSD